MRFDRSNATPAEHRTLPTYPWFCMVVGASWAFDPGSRLGDSAGLRFAGHWTPFMGIVVLIIGVWLEVMLLLGEHARRERFDYGQAYTHGLGVLVFWMYAWALVLLGAAIFGHATWAAWAWPTAFGRLAWASMVALEAREV